MKNIVDELLDVFTLLEDCYKRLLDVAEAKNAAIRTHDTDGLRFTLRDEAQLLEEIKVHDQARHGIVARFAKIMNADERAIRASDLRTFCTAPQRQRLDALTNSLTDLAERTQFIDGLNRTMIRDNLEYVSYVLNAMSGTTITNNYGNAGTFDGNELIRRPLLDDQL